MSTGYLAVTLPFGTMKALIDPLTPQRRGHYPKMADENGTSLQAVESVAEEKVIGKTAAGNNVLSGDGRVKK